MIRFSFSYDKKKVIQALRFHFIWQKDIKATLIIILIFDIISAVLFYSEVIRPEPFLLGSVVWLFFIVSCWFILPWSIYKKSATFKERFSISFSEDSVFLEGGNSQMRWDWKQIIHFRESPEFFHFYFTAKSFLIIPKSELTADHLSSLRKLINRKV
jgi:hypothetical protein